MCKSRIPLYLMTVFFLTVLAFSEWFFIQQEDVPFSVIVVSEDGSEKINCWKKDGVYFVFLPSYADPERTSLKTSRLASASIDGTPVSEQTVCADFPMNKQLPLTYRKLGKNHEEMVYFVQSGNVSTMYVDVASGSMTYIHEKKGNAEPGEFRLYTSEGKLDCTAQIQAINGRGNATWSPPKKAYSLELTEETDLLGMGAAKKWILLANWYDSSNVKNKMVYDFAADTGALYSPECQWADLYLNGEYAGLYLISERNELHSQRIAVDSNKSFLISMSMESRLVNVPYFQSEQNNFMRIHETGLSVDEMWNIWQSVENAVSANDGIDPLTGKDWLELVDLDSWVQQLLLDEVFVENDACALSQYFYYEPQSGKLFAGPVWDADGILNWDGKYPANILASLRPYVWDMGYKSVFYMIYQKEEFYQRVKQMYATVYRPKLLELAEGGIEEYARQCRSAAITNCIRWDMAEPDAEVKRMSEYLKERIAFLDDYWGNEEDYYIIDLSSDIQWRRFAVRKGDTAQFLQVYSEIYGDVSWKEYEGGAVFDIGKPVNQNYRLVMKWPES